MITNTSLACMHRRRKNFSREFTGAYNVFLNVSQLQWNLGMDWKSKRITHMNNFLPFPVLIMASYKWQLEVEYSEDLSIEGKTHWFCSFLEHVFLPTGRNFLAHFHKPSKVVQLVRITLGLAWIHPQLIDSQRRVKLEITLISRTNAIRKVQ